MIEYITKEEALMALTGVDLPEDRNEYIALVNERLLNIKPSNVIDVDKLNHPQAKLNRIRGIIDKLNDRFNHETALDLLMEIKYIVEDWKPKK